MAKKDSDYKSPSISMPGLAKPGYEKPNLAKLSKEAAKATAPEILTAADKIESVQVFEIPNNTVKPINRRIFVVGFTPDEKKTKGGIVIATSFEQMKGDNKIKRNYRRWFVIDVAVDVSIRVPIFNKEGKTEVDTATGAVITRPLQRGDEVFPFMTEDATDWKPPYIIDWNNGGMKYYTFEELEIAGVGIIPAEAEGD